jgi:uncharacterized protein (TIGR02001 family)
MRKSLLALAVTSAFALPSIATAQTAPAAAAASPITGNMTIATDYRFRGISQTYLGPTIQGGLDYAHPSGFYVGNWNSNVSGNTYAGGPGIEMDFYGGWKTTFGDFGLDLGAIYYYYGDARATGVTGAGVATQEKYNNGELYIGGSWKWLSLKYNYSVTDYFGFNDNVARNFASRSCTSGGACGGVAGTDFVGANGGSKGTGYWDFSANYEIAPKTNLVGHIGRLQMKHYGNFFNYTDYKVGATYDWTGWILGAAIVGTNAKKEWNYVAGTPFNTTTGVPKVKNSGEPTIVLSVSKTF